MPQTAERPVGPDFAGVVDQAGKELVGLLQAIVLEIEKRKLDVGQPTHIQMVAIRPGISLHGLAQELFLFPLFGLERFVGRGWDRRGWRRSDGRTAMQPGRRSTANERQADR